MPSTYKETRKVGIIIGSTRSQRVGPYIANYVHNLLNGNTSNTQVDVIDLQEHPLPLFDDTVLPAHLPPADPTPHYEQEHSRKWSSVIRDYDAFIFVTPQYNWSIPAALKNALDYLYHEWASKPAVIVTYGAKGGCRAGLHLENILTGLHMKPIEPVIALPLSLENGDTCIKTKAVLDEDRERWASSGLQDSLKAAFDQLCKYLDE
ncbi:hypothetical protein K4F52_000920 [Lecanicillium sp. MT-2017a]|nr:hypothetical protein K4F52_000920 [Lecanicillium sp. MT-2017a]